MIEGLMAFAVAVAAWLGGALDGGREAFYDTDLAARSGFEAGDPASVAEELRRLGYRALLDADGEVPYVASAMEGAEFDISFHHCGEDGTDCFTMIFYASFILDARTPPATLDRWNREEFIGRAYLSEDGASVIEHFVVVEGGMTPENFEAVLGWWGYALDRYMEHIGF